MTSSQRIIVNTIAQYTRTLINVCLSLYSTRLILAALGQMDYGIYSLVAGVVTMLSFVTNAMVTTTQRYLSYQHGAGNNATLSNVFANSVLLHLVIGVAIMLILFALEPLLIGGYLNIDHSRIVAATWVYLSAVVMLLLTFVTAPYRALFIARENIVYISIVDVIDGVLKLAIAIALGYFQGDQLIWYAILLIFISIFNLLAFGLYAHLHFEECRCPRLNDWDTQYIRQLSGFAGWTIYSTGCIIARTQGLAVILNKFVGTIANAAYGVAQQVTGAIQFIATAITNAMSPQIVKAEGQNDRQRMLMLAEQCSKYAYLLLAMLTLPIVAEMPAILTLWLKDVPEHTVMLCRGVLLAAMLDQITIGLGLANQAIGQIRTYSLVINTIKVLTLPAVVVCLWMGFDMLSVVVCYVGFELLCALCRLPFLQQTAGLSVHHYTTHVLLPIVLPTLLMCAACYGMLQISIAYRCIITILVSWVVGVISIYCFALSSEERHVIHGYLRQLIARINRKTSK